MGACACHPEKETRFMCMKHGVYLCDECLDCRDPNIYCKHRPSCPIWFLRKRQKGLEDAADDKEAKGGAVDLPA